MSTLLNISGKIEPRTVALFETVSRVMTDLEIPYVVVGATARDIVLHYGHGAALERATIDVDFAIEVPNWTAFDALKNRLCEQGFKTSNAQHRLISPMGTEVDIVPFGDIENGEASITWPPGDEVIMNVLGFQEACDTAEWVRVQDRPKLDVPVVTPAGLVLLKIIAWSDRARDLRGKDAMDISYLLSTYEKITAVMDALYESNNTQIMEVHDWDITLSAAYLLGRHASDIAQKKTKTMINRFTNKGLDSLNMERLVEEMCDDVDTQFDRNWKLLSAFMDGFNQN
ncbi:hypothetical protein BMS3Abin11_02417 [bacterium BMS3Abin11]|nr:hypothetical protein BMS3Abin11_02417 [bacterium BMS3Abin11]